MPKQNRNISGQKWLINTNNSSCPLFFYQPSTFQICAFKHQIFPAYYTLVDLDTKHLKKATLIFEKEFDNRDFFLYEMLTC